MPKNIEQDLKATSYSTYFKTLFASAFTLSTFLLAKTTGFFPTWFSSNESSETNLPEADINNHQSHQLIKRQEYLLNLSTYNLVYNNFTLTQNATTNITSTMLYVNGSNNLGLALTIGELTHGYFTLIPNISEAVFNFTQQDIADAKIQFVHDGSLDTPSFQITYSYPYYEYTGTLILRNIKIVPVTIIVNAYANVALIIHNPPVLVVNQLAIFEGQTIILNSGNLQATNVYHNVSNLLFIISDILHGQFSILGNTTQSITQFRQFQVSEGEILFTQDGGKLAPSYNVSINDGVISTTPVPTLVNFVTVHNKPQILNTIISIAKGQTIILNATNLNSTGDGTNASQLVWTVINIQRGTFSVVGNPNIDIFNFTQLQINQQIIQFTQDSSNQAPAFSLLLGDGIDLIGPVSMSISFTNQGNTEQYPTLMLQPLFVNQGEVLTISSNEIRANSTIIDPQQLQFIVSQVNNGRFQLSTNPGVAITEFLQLQITNNTLQFTQLGSGTNIPAFQISVTDGNLATSPIDGPINFDAAPQLINNLLVVTNGQTVTFTNTYLQAIDVDSNNATLQFIISNITHGQFKIANTVYSLTTNFPQQQIWDNVVSFIHDGSGSAPSYLVSVSDGRITTAMQPATISFTNAALRQAPVLGNHQLVVNQNEVTTLTSSEMSAWSSSVDNATLVFIVDQIGNGLFQLATLPGVFITQFSQATIVNGSVQFAYIGSGLEQPFFQVAVSDGELTSNFTNATINFDAAPQLVNNMLTISNGGTVVMTANNLQAFDFDSNNATLLFKPSAIIHGYFQSSTNGPVTHFTKQNITNGVISFVHDGSGIAPSYTVSVTDGRASSANQTATISFLKQNNEQYPTLTLQPLLVNQGEVSTLTSSEISANSTTIDPQQLAFIVSQVANGRFQLSNNPGVAITEFLQAQITNSTVQFTQLGSGTAIPAFQISVTDGNLTTSPINGPIHFDAAPQLINNQLTITNGQSVTLTSNYLQAIDVDSNNATLQFIISNITHGQFKIANTVYSLTADFPQQQIVDGVVSFIHDGSGIAPSYLVSVSDGRITIAMQPATVSFTNAAVRQTPVLGNHQFSINQDAMITLTTGELSGWSSSVNNATLLFIVNTIGNGRFQFTTVPGVFITQFTQQGIVAGNVQFAHLGSGLDLPFYQVAVSDGELTSNFVSGTITFNAAPEIINNTLSINNGETITLNSNNLQAIDRDSSNATLLFILSDIVHGDFISTKNSSKLINNFTQQELTNGTIQFVHDGSNIPPSYTVSVMDDQGASSPNQTATVLFDSAKNSSNLPAIVGGVVAGASTLGVLAAALGLFAKNQIDESTRNKHRLANYIWRELKLQGIDNFGTDLGKKYVSIIENELVPELKQHNYDTDTMQDRDLRELAKNIAAVAKNKITHSTTFFGASLVTVDDLSRNISTIVTGILDENIFDNTEDKYYLLENDDVNIPLKSYVPSMRLSNKGYENV